MEQVHRAASSEGSLLPRHRLRAGAGAGWLTFRGTASRAKPCGQRQRAAWQTNKEEENIMSSWFFGSDKPMGGEARAKVVGHEVFWCWLLMIAQTSALSPASSATRTPARSLAASESGCLALCLSSRADPNGRGTANTAEVAGTLPSAVLDSQWTQPSTSPTPQRPLTWPTSASSSCTASPTLAMASRSRQQSAGGHHHLPPHRARSVPAKQDHLQGWRRRHRRQHLQPLRLDAPRARTPPVARPSLSIA